MIIFIIKHKTIILSQKHCYCFLLLLYYEYIITSCHWQIYLGPHTWSEEVSVGDLAMVTMLQSKR